MNLPLEIYDLLERRLGRDDAMAVAKSIEASLTHIEERSREIAAQRKLEAKEELKRELRDELTTKEDLAKLEGSLREDLAKLEGSLREDLVKLDKKFSMYFLATIFTVIFLNQNALEFLARILGLIK
ncbi:MAG: hypothetical protein ACK4Q6_11325 [Tepidimonas ignava]|uniref:hypothetical protein n=1 Tax=Tepidimonas ignava TaxID=114249 RepID=UPI0039199754